MSPDRRTCNVWCYLAYWEERTRVGERFIVSEPNVDVFALTPDPPEGSGFCLQTVFNKNPRPSDKVISTRKKIGRGEHDGHVAAKVVLRTVRAF